MSKIVVRIALSWLPLAVAITGACLLVYASVQQNYRQSLNDPQIQMAEDAAAALASGISPSRALGLPVANASSSVNTGVKINIVSSLAPWLAVYDDAGIPIQSTGMLDDAMPVPPQGIFETARANAGNDTSIPGQNRVTWQPTAGVRQALVVQEVSGESGGFVVAGRNMREVEEREARLSYFVLLAWLALILATLAAAVAASFARSQIH